MLSPRVEFRGPDVKGAPPPKEKLKDFYQELEQLLRKQLEQQPGVIDVRVKLIELYYETHRADAFLKAAHELRRRIKDLGASRDWQRVASMGRMLIPGEAIFSGDGSDKIEFIGDVDLPAQPTGKRVRRFGDDESYRALFASLAAQYEPVRKDGKFLAELELLLIGLPTRRPTPLVATRHLSQRLGGAQIYLKREDFAGESPHLTIAVAGQGLLAKKLGRKTLVTAASDGRRGVITASVAARLGLTAVVYIDAEQADRVAANLLFMRLMGARVEIVRASQYHNKDVREAALAHWAKDPDNTFLVTGVDAAPPPYPLMTQEFTTAVGRECKRQMIAATSRLPDVVVTRGSHTADALGIFPAFLGEEGVRLVCVDAEPEPEKPAPRDAPKATAGLTANERKVAQNILERLEYPSVAREHAWFRASGRVEYVQTTRAAARNAVHEAARLEATVLPVESAHVLAWACEAARSLAPQKNLVVVLNENLERGVWDLRRLVEEA